MPKHVQRHLISTSVNLHGLGKQVGFGFVSVKFLSPSDAQCLSTRFSVAAVQRFSACVYQRGGNSEFLIHSETVFTKLTWINVPCGF